MKGRTLEQMRPPRRPLLVAKRQNGSWSFTMVVFLVEEGYDRRRRTRHVPQQPRKCKEVWVHGHVIVIFMLLCVLELEKVGEPSRRLEYDVITQNDVSKPRHGPKEYDGGGATAMHDSCSCKPAIKHDVFILSLSNQWLDPTTVMNYPTLMIFF
jgi:hypothetical protein